MSRIRIEHVTAYTYHRPVEFGRHRLVVRPREGHDINVESMQLSIEPRHRLRWVLDVFGNSVAIVDFLEPASQLRVESKVVIRRHAPFPLQQEHPTETIPVPVEYAPMESAVVAAYQQPSYPEESEAVLRWARQCLTPDDHARGAEHVLLKLGLTIHQQIRYQRRMEKGVQSPAQSIHAQSGSCRDLATLMMDAARGLGFAARFVSGYLDCPASEAGRAAMHAWVEIYLPTHGWWGFDPTLNETVSLKHVVAGVSNHPRGVMPVSGTFTGTSADFSGMSAQVRIESLDIGDSPSASPTQGSSIQEPPVPPAS